MSKTSTTKRALNSTRNHNSNSRGANQTHSRRQAAAAEAKTLRVSLRNASSGRLPLGGKKTTRKKRLSRQQAADSELRDTLNAEFRDLRTTEAETMDTVQQSRGLQLPDSTAFTPSQPKVMSEAAGFDPLAQQLPEKSVQDLAGILSTL